MKIPELQEKINGKSDAELIELALNTTDITLLNTLAAHSNHFVVQSACKNSNANLTTIEVIVGNRDLSENQIKQFIAIIENKLTNNQRASLLATINQRVKKLTD